MKRLLSLASVSLIFLPTFATAVITPEQESKRLGQILKPIPDEIWKSVAGERASEKYSVLNGDTLFDISKRLFGDAKYWPKIWAINNKEIGNPHRILPGMMIAFLPGTGSALPSVDVEGNLSDASEGLTTESSGSPQSRSKSGRSEEWRDLPQQPWEIIRLQLPPEIDPQGFDRRSKISFKTTTDFELESIVTSEILEPIGSILGALANSNDLDQGSYIFIRSENNIQVGETYSITEAPFVLNPKGVREGYSYRSLGKVKVTGVRDGVYLGLITNARSPIGRSAFLMPVPPKARLGNPIPGPSPIEAVLHFDTRFSTQFVNQFRQVFIDQGSEDGIQSGMIFRAYETKDPTNQNTIAPDKFLPMTDVMVVQVSPRFSSGILLTTPNPVPNKTRVTLLTDVSDVGKAWKPGSSPEIDELEKLDPGSGLRSDEERELIQLERHKEKTETPEEIPAPTSTPEDNLDEGTVPTVPTEPTPEATPTPTPTATPEPAITPEPAPEIPVDIPPPPPPPSGEELPPPPDVDAGAVEFPPPPELE